MTADQKKSNCDEVFEQAIRIFVLLKDIDHSQSCFNYRISKNTKGPSIFLTSEVKNVG